MDERRDSRAHWNRRYADDGALDEPASFLLDHADVLPRTGTALDVAGGAGRNAVWLVQRGLEVTLADVSDTACGLARARAEAAGVTLRVLRRDLEVEGYPAGPWDVVLVHLYRDRRIVAAAPDLLAPGGLLLLCQPTVRNLECHDRPPRQFLLAEGELARQVADLHGDVVQVVTLWEGWTAEGRHEAHLVLRRK